MYDLLFTLDYEIHGNGDGDPMALMVEPTKRLMALMERYGQRLTIMADVAEILAFRRYYEQTGEDRFSVLAIEQQLRDVVQRGHDVQLHIHSSYFRAHYDGTRWDQCIEDYNMAALPYERIDDMIRTCVAYLDRLLKPVCPDYKVRLFQAANWSMMPTENLYKALLHNGITCDTSVYKGGCQGGNVSYDYRTAYSNRFPYTASMLNINDYDPQGLLTEYPIYTEMKPFYYFISPMRIFRMLRAKLHKHKHSAAVATPASASGAQADNRKLTLRSFFVKSPLKMDFNQVSGRGLIRMYQHIAKADAQLNATPQPVVLIGHSKTFIPYNEKTLEPFLRYLDSVRTNSLSCPNL